MRKNVIPEYESKLTRWERFWNELHWLWVIAAALAIAAVYLELARRGYW
jgi:uncharacterized membrane protein